MRANLHIGGYEVLEFFPVNDMRVSSFTAVLIENIGIVVFGGNLPVNGDLICVLIR
jgi:hypothetical protein